MKSETKKITPELSKKMVEIAKKSPLLQTKLNEAKALMNQIKLA